MIKVYTNKENYQNDIYSLIKAFYPEQEVKIYGMNFLEQEGLYSLVIVQFFANRLEVFFDIKFKDNNKKRYTNVYKNDTSVTKDTYKLSFYEDLCDYTGKILPWGNLTGIRPTKLSMRMLSEGMCEEEIVRQLKISHAVSEEKAKLSIDIAKREQHILNSMHYKDGYSLYIGIPFCPTTCLYCSFTSYPIAVWQKHIPAYLQALFQELDFTANFYQNKILDTIYIGGGTPTSLDAEALDLLLDKVHKTFDFSQIQEFTVEAGRADSITKEKLDVLKKHGITRISINPQTMKEETLRCIGRQHTVAQVKEAFSMARSIGFDNINMDIILGLPGELETDVQFTIDEIKKLNPDSLTVHSLAVKRASHLCQWIEENGMTTLRNTDATMEIASKGARELGMNPYYLYRQKNMSGNFENVGYAKEGKYGIYNILIMEEVQTIVAVGAGTVTKRVFEDGRIKRCDTVKDVAQYIDRIDEMIERKRALFAAKELE